MKVKYDKLFENFRTYSSFHGFLCTDIQVETFFQKETLCEGRQPEECGVWIEFRDLVTGERIETAAIDPDNKEQQEKVLQAAERLADRLRDEMLAPSRRRSGRSTSRARSLQARCEVRAPAAGQERDISFKSPFGRERARDRAPGRASAACGRAPRATSAETSTETAPPTAVRHA